MEMDLAAVFDRPKRLWHSLTGGGLAVVEGESKPMRSVRGRKLPVAIRNALTEGSTLDAHKTRGGVWWATVPSLGLQSQVRLVAWAASDDNWGDILQVWTDMLAFAKGEHAVADRLTEALVNAWDRLTFLYELTHIVGQLTDLPDMLNSIVHLLAEVVSAEEVFLITGVEAYWTSVTVSGDSLSLPPSIAEEIFRARRPVGLAELKPALEKAENPLAQAGDLLVAPLMSGDRPSGMIGLLDPHEDRFDSNDVLLLASVAEQVGALIEAAQARITREESRRLDHELKIAAGIQSGLLPDSLPSIKGLELAAYLQPARQVGGDLYDVAESETGESMLLLADVAGKGSPAAILSTVVRSVFRSEAPHSSDPGELLKGMNRLLYPDLDKAETFVTAVSVNLKSDSLGFSYASAGHVDIAIWRDREQKVEFFPATGLPLGIDPKTSYYSQLLALHPGDTLLLYSDGATEAEDPNGSILGMQGLSDIIYAVHPAPVEEQIRVILESLDVHCHSQSLSDDVTLLMVRALPVSDVPVETIPFVIPTEFLAVRKVVDIVRGLGSALPIPDQDERMKLMEDFALAISEVVTNQIKHAFQGRKGQILGRVVVETDRLVADLYDSGLPFQLPEISWEPIDIDNPPESGYGLVLVRGLLDKFECHRLDGVRNHWHLVKEFAGGDMQ